jgi:hypothetical protein
MSDETTGRVEDVGNVTGVGPTGNAGTSDDANWIGTIDNVRPADRHATGGSGDTPGTIGDATGPLATPSGTSGGYGAYAPPETAPGAGGGTGKGAAVGESDSGMASSGMASRRESSAPGVNANTSGSPAAEGGTTTGRALGASGTAGYRRAANEDDGRRQGDGGMGAGLGSGRETGSTATNAPRGGKHPQPGEEPLT